MTKQRKAIALISGGLDSMLAARAVMEQGIRVEGINFFTGFCVEGHTHAIRKQDQRKQKRNSALWVAEQLDIPLHIVDIVEDYKDVLLNPRHGYGANLNPCLDCKVFMVDRARQWAEEHDFDFIVTGEVVGQRPKSQRKETMPLIAAESGADDRLLRPLCAKLLPPTLAEREGWVDRQRLYDFSGRSRKPQMALAAEFGFDEYSQPAGGCCFLTDANYAVKLQDMWDHRPSRDYELDDIMLLKVGRHLRPKPGFKLIVSREEGENNFLMGYRKQFVHLFCTSHPGPLVLVDGELPREDEELAARIVTRFGKSRDTARAEVELVRPGEPPRLLNVASMCAADVPQSWYL